MPLTYLKNTLVSAFEKTKETFIVGEKKALESLPEPYIPTIQEIADMPEKLREKATKALHGKGANPSQLGDPVSLKAEQSDNVPKSDEGGAKSSSTPSSSKELHGSQSGSSEGPKGRGEETLREKATKKLNGPDANPSQLGDPISLKAEQSDHIPKPEEEGTKKNRDSKL